jgi:formylglycine-generating enzyme required for sulfatase activity
MTSGGARAGHLLAVAACGVMLALLPGAVRGAPTAGGGSAPHVLTPGLLTPGLLTLVQPRPNSVLLPGATVRMGSTPEELWRVRVDCQREPLRDDCTADHYADETPVRSTRVSPFWLDVTEVSVREYDQCVRLRHCDPIPYFRGATRFRRLDYPASFLTWNEARQYCRFLGKRLPTEAEFERAARGEQQRTYPWGNLYNSRVSNHGQLALSPTSDVDGYPELAPVGSFPDGATPRGILDLAGNVAEWVYDRYDVHYDSKDTQDPRGPDSTGVEYQRVIRGGHFQSPRSDLRSASRDAAEPDARHPGYGFRCARSRAPRGE